MFKTMYGLTVCIILLVASGCASQQELQTAILDESQNEFEFAASILNQDSITTLSSQATALYHISPEFQLGYGADLVYIDAPDGSLSSTGAGAEARYNLQTEGQFLPFIGGSLRYVSIRLDDVSEFGFGYALNGGFRVPMTPAAFLVMKLQYTAVSIDDYEGDNFGLFVGISVRR